MRIIKEILGRIFALWAILTFTITLLVVYIPVWLTKNLPEPKRTDVVLRMMRQWMDVWFLLTGVRRIITGHEHFRPGENYVVVSNHASFMDVPLASPAVPGANKTIAKIEIARTPLFGLIYKRGSVLVDRKSEESRRASYARMKEVLELGMHMCIYPEGTRNKGREPLQKFQDGAFRLAVETGKPVIPSLIFHTATVLPRNKIFYFWPHPVEMHFLPPVPSTNKTPQQLKEEVFRIMYDFYVSRKGK